MAAHTSANPTFPFGRSIVWQPDPTQVAQTDLAAFMARHGIATYDDLLLRAVDDVGWFWDAVLADLGIEFYRPYTTVFDPTPGIAYPKWCVDGEMNIVHNCLDKWLATAVRDRPALHWEGEEGGSATLTYAELAVEVNRCANALRSLGLGKGDAVGLYMPMIPELAIAFLAIIKIGGIILPLFSGYGPGAMVARLADADAKALFTADGLLRRGQKVAMKSVADQAVAEVPSIRHVVVVERAGLPDAPWTAGRDHWWHELVPQQSAECPNRTHLRRGRADGDLYQRHDWQTQGCGPYALRLSRSKPPRTCASHGPQGGRDNVLADGYGLDDGAVAGLWQPAQRRHHGVL